MFPNWQTGDINLPLCEILLYEVPMCTRIFTNQLKFQPLMINEPAHMNYRAGIFIHPASIRFPSSTVCANICCMMHLQVSLCGRGMPVSARHNCSFFKQLVNSCPLWHIKAAQCRALWTHEYERGIIAFCFP